MSVINFDKTKEEIDMEKPKRPCKNCKYRDRICGHCHSSVCHAPDFKPWELDTKSEATPEQKEIEKLKNALYLVTSTVGRLEKQVESLRSTIRNHNVGVYNKYATEDENIIALNKFLEQKTTPLFNGAVTVTELYISYNKWAMKTKMPTRGSKRIFGEDVEGLNIPGTNRKMTKKRKSKGTCWEGITLK